MTDEPIVLTHEEHVTEIMRLWRQKRRDEIAKDIIYNEQMIAVSRAMYEPEPFRFDRAVAAIWSGYFAFISFGCLLWWEMVR